MENTEEEDICPMHPTPVPLISLSGLTLAADPADAHPLSPQEFTAAMGTVPM